MLNRRLPLVALALSGILWGTSAPLTKVALGALDPGWLTVVRFVLAGGPLLWAARGRLREATSPAVLASGALGYGVVVALWNAGLARTSVTHGALLVAGVPALVAVIAFAAGHGSAGVRAWVGYVAALAGVVLVASTGGTASMTGDLLVITSMAVSAAFTVAQPSLLRGRDPIAVTAVQFVASAAVALPIALVTGGLPRAGGSTGAWAAVGALVVTGTLLPFTLFAWAQAQTSPQVAGAFLNLEPVVGAACGALVFGDPFGPVQVVGGLAVLGGIALSALPALPALPARVRALRPAPAR